MVLYLSDAEGVTGDGLFKYPSRFLFETGQEHVMRLAESSSAATGAGAADQAASPPEIACFAVDDMVRHPAFGPGKILSVDFAAQAYAVAFDSLPTPRNIRFGASLQPGSE